MNLTRLLFATLPLMSWSCAAPQKVRLTAFNLGEYENNWDKLLISKVDGRRITPPQEEVTFAAGTRTVTFSINYMRGNIDHPILAEVPVTANFTADHYQAHVRYQTIFMGVIVAKPAGGPILGGAMVYSPEFSANLQKANR